MISAALRPVLLSVSAHNTDGIDVHGSPAWIHDCIISTGDDNVAMHASDTLVERCTFGAGHGASIGSLGAGTALKNITVRDCSFTGTSQAVRIKADTDATGYLRDVTYSNLVMDKVGMSLLVTDFYPKPDGKQNTLAISNVVFSNIVSNDATAAGQFLCSSQAPCEGLTVSNVTHTGSAPTPWQCENAKGTVTGVTPSLTCL